MMIRRFLAASVLALAVVGGSIACQKSAPEPSQPAPAPAASPAPGKLGMNANFLPEVAATVSEMGVVDYLKAADTQDGGGETLVGVIGPGAANIALSTCNFAPAAALTASDTQFATITVYKRTPLADASTVLTQLGSVTTKTSGSGGTGSWSQNAPVSIPVDAGAYVAPGDVVTVGVAKTGGGVVVPAGQLNCYTTIN